MSTIPAAGVQPLIDKAQADLFGAVDRQQRPLLAEAWANLRRAAALLCELQHGRVPDDRLREAVERAQAGVQALTALTAAQHARSGA